MLFNLQDSKARRISKNKCLHTNELTSKCACHCHQLLSAIMTRLNWAARSPVESVDTSIRHRQAAVVGMAVVRNTLSPQTMGEE